jgi:hypothetical protein
VLRPVAYVPKMFARFSEGFVLDASRARARVTYVSELSLGSLQEPAAIRLEVFRRRLRRSLGALAQGARGGCAGLERDLDPHQNVGRLRVLFEEVAAA